MRRFLLALVAPLLLAAGPPMVPGMGGDAGELPQGAWVRYRVTDHTGTVREFSISVVGTEMHEGAKGIWLEYEMYPVPGHRNLLKTLLVGDMANPAATRRMVFQPQGMPPIKVPINEGMRQQMTPPKLEPAPVPKGKAGVHKAQKVVTPAGSFKARATYFEIGGQRTTLWQSDDVPITRLVKAKTPTRYMELIATGKSGAKSKITGKPTAMMDRFRKALKRGAAEGGVLAPKAPRREGHEH